MPAFPAASHGSSSPGKLSRRVALRLGGGAALTVALATGLRPVTAQDTATPSVFEGDAFVGGTDRPDLLAAVVIGATEARGYLCDGTSLVTWFTGPAAPATLELASQAGDRMTVTVGAAGVEGRATLAGGDVVTFTAAPATGIAGLYEVVVDGVRFAGGAAGGLRLEGVVAGKLPDGTLLLAGAVALPDGGLQPLAVFATPDAVGEQRWIVLDDGRVTGGFKKGSGSGYIDPVHDLAVPRGESYIDPTTDI